MDPVAALFLPACLLAILFAMRSPEHAYERTLLAVVMLMEWAAGNLAWLASDMRAFALMDATVLALSIALFWPTITGWPRRFVALAALQLLFDIAAETNGFRAYVLWACLQDATAVAQLVILSGPGAAFYVRYHFPRGLSDADRAP